MTDRDKVIKGLEKCKRHECDDCTEKGASQAPWDCPAYDDFVDSALALLKEQPEIVRCKDCIYADDFDCPAPLPTGYLCQKGHGSHLGHWFCADGER